MSCQWAARPKHTHTHTHTCAHTHTYTHLHVSGRQGLGALFHVLLSSLRRGGRGVGVCISTRWRGLNRTSVGGNGSVIWVGDEEHKLGLARGARTDANTTEPHPRTHACVLHSRAACSGQDSPQVSPPPPKLTHTHTLIHTRTRIPAAACALRARALRPSPAPPCPPPCRWPGARLSGCAWAPSGRCAPGTCTTG